MVHPGRFELPTARFVAEYSIQLSYGCSFVFLNFTEAFQRVKLNNKIDDLEDGAPRKIRTSDRSVRSRVLYPAELWVQLIL